MQEQNQLQVAQDRETAVQIVRRPPFTYRYAYARAAETRDAGQLGQDYLVLRESEQTLVFALCDGVGESFYGEMAARFLGEALVGWLWSEVPAGSDEKGLRASLSGRLAEWTEPASKLVQQQPLPAGVPKLQLEAMEEKRLLGSQTTFLCGRIDLASQGLPRGRVILAWMGDSRARTWGPKGERSAELAGPFDAAQRWSSSRGALGGEPNVFVEPLRKDGQTLHALMVYSDGLAGLDQVAGSPANRELQQLVNKSGEAAVSDDISFLEVWVGRTPPWAEVVALEVPLLLELAVQEGGLRATWQPVAGATHYELEVIGEQRHAWQTEATRWISSRVSPGSYRVRVRAWRGKEASAWSAQQSVVIPAPVEAPAVGAPAPPPTAPAPQPVAPVPVTSAPARPTPPKVAAPAPVRRRGRGGMLAGLLAAASVVLVAAVLMVVPEWGPLYPFVWRQGQQPTSAPLAIAERAPTPRLTATASATLTPTRTPWPTASSTATPTETEPASPTRTPLAEASPSPSGGPDMAGLLPITAANAKDIKPLHPLPGHQSPVLTVGFSIDGSVLASGADDGTVKLWSLIDGEPPRELDRMEGAVLSVAFAPRGEQLAAVSEDGVVWRWDTAQGKALAEPQRLAVPVQSMVFFERPEGPTVLAAGVQKETVFLRWLTGDDGKSERLPAPQIRSVALSVNGRWMAWALKDGTIELWNVSDLKKEGSLKGGESPAAVVAFSANGVHLAAGFEDQRIMVWELSDLEQPETLEVGTSQVRSLAFSPGDRVLASGRENGTVQLWDVSSGKFIHQLDEHNKPVRALVFSLDGKVLASGSDDQTVVLWGIRSP